MDEAAAYAAYRGRRRFGSLDGLRAFAVVGTVWHHTTVGLGWAVPTWIGSDLLGAGDLGVQLFFAISGFLITTLLLREHAATGSVNLRGFYVRRVLRIFPAYYLTVVLYVALALTIFSASPQSQRFIGHLPAFLTYTVNWFVPVRAGETLFVHGWSLSTEEQFYLIWPLMLLAAMTRRRPLLLVAGAALGLAGVKIAAGVVLGPSFLTAVLTSLALPICGGAALAALLHSQAGFALALRVLGRPWSAPAAVLLLSALVAVGVRFELVVIGLVTVVGACAIAEEHPLAPLLRWRPVAYIGEVSYGVYLYHLIVLWLVRWYLGLPAGLVLFAVVLLVSLWAAAVSFRFFEMPFLRLRDRYRTVVVQPVPSAP